MADLLLGGIAINEVLVDPNGAINFDTDGNGTAGSTDEYIELVNTTGAAIDISGLELWDAGVGNWFTFPPGTILEAGAHAMVMSGVQAGGSLPTGGPDDLFFDAGRGGALINNGGDNIIVYDPGADEYIAATFNGDALDNPTAGAGGYSGFSATATQNGSGEDFGNDTDGESLQREPDGSDTFVSNTPTPGVSNVCFASGTAISTPTGTKPVELLRSGDFVSTLDHGPQKVKWVYAQTCSVADMQSTPSQAPVLIGKGALGNGLPLHDLRVSQQHRILVRSAIAQRMYGEHEVLIAAKHLTNLPEVSVENSNTSVTYHHVMLECHEVLYAEGVLAESLYLGKQTLKTLPASGIRELETLLGQTVMQMLQKSPPQARAFISGKRTQKLMLRHKMNSRPLVENPAPKPYYWRPQQDSNLQPPA